MTAYPLPESAKLPVPFVFSQSSLQDYSDCPRRFYLRHLVQMVWPAVESEPAAEYERRQQEGLLFHRLVQQDVLGVPPENLSRLASGPDLGRWWQNYRSASLGLEGHATYSELTLSSRVDTHRVIAKFDLVAIKDHQALIYDWKTYARRPREEHLAARWQTRIYRLLMADAGAGLNGGTPFAPDRIKMIYWFAEFPAEPAHFTYDQAQIQRDRSALASIVAEISAASAAREFPMTEDRNRCRFCSFRSFCDRGRNAGDWREAETDMQPEAIFDLNLEQIPEIEF